MIRAAQVPLSVQSLVRYNNLSGRTVLLTKIPSKLISKGGTYLTSPNSLNVILKTKYLTPIRFYASLRSWDASRLIFFFVSIAWPIIISEQKKGPLSLSRLQMDDREIHRASCPSTVVHLAQVWWEMAIWVVAGHFHVIMRTPRCDTTLPSSHHFYWATLSSLNPDSKCE